MFLDKFLFNNTYHACAPKILTPACTITGKKGFIVHKRKDTPLPTNLTLTFTSKLTQICPENDFSVCLDKKSVPT
jgi:hypothetical protein